MADTRTTNKITIQDFKRRIIFYDQVTQFLDENEVVISSQVTGGGKINMPEDFEPDVTLQRLVYDELESNLQEQKRESEKTRDRESSKIVIIDEELANPQPPPAERP